MSKRTSDYVLDENSKKLKLSKPSLDSDEEDYDENCFRLHEANIEGQEPETLDYDDDIKITPFNMKEELEDDGHFDACGTFIFKKSDDAMDNWLEDINWLEVKKRERNNPLKDTAISDENKTTIDNNQKLELYKQILKYLNPSENVLRGIKRMGVCSDSKTSASASQRWLKKKSVQPTQSGDPEGLLRLTELADQLFQVGDFDIYQKTYENVSDMIKRMEHAASDDELEALGQAFDGDKNNGHAKLDGKDDDGNHVDELENFRVMWYLKRSQEDGAATEGPYTSEQLKKWVEEDKFKDSPCVLVRQSNKPNGQFYNISRLDFDLYC